MPYRHSWETCTPDYIDDLLPVHLREVTLTFVVFLNYHLLSLPQVCRTLLPSKLLLVTLLLIIQLFANVRFFFVSRGG